VIVSQLVLLTEFNDFIFGFVGDAYHNGVTVSHLYKHEGNAKVPLQSNNPSVSRIACTTAPDRGRQTGFLPKLLSHVPRT
jgi:hypothetical protein